MLSLRQRHLYIAGFMGSGKSAVGSAVAARLNRVFYDLDDVVMSMTHRAIDTIFRVEGERAFRRYEAKALRTIVASASAVIALGGGAPTVPGIADMVRHTGHTVLLTANWETIWERIKGDHSRPLLADFLGENHADTADQFEQFVTRADSILQQRRAAYNAIADWTIDTSGLSIADVAHRILVLTGEHSL